MFKKNEKKKERKKSIHEVHDHYYHGGRMKYLHYDDRGYYTKTQQIQERVEKKALLKFHRFKKESTNKGISRIHS
jgi:hypothetical protein